MNSSKALCGSQNLSGFGKKLGIQRLWIGIYESDSIFLSVSIINLLIVRGNKGFEPKPKGL